MKAYSMDLRAKIVEFIRRGVSKSETSHRFGVNRSTIRRYPKQLDEESALVPKRAPGKPSKLNEGVIRLLEEDIRARPWATHRQRGEFLSVACGVEVSEARLCRAIKGRLSRGRKKICSSKRAGQVAKISVASDDQHARIQPACVRG